MANGGFDVAYQLDSSVVTDEEARWVEELPEAPREEQAEVVRRLQKAATANDRRTLHLAGMGFAQLGRVDQAIAAFERASKLDPADALDIVNAAVGLVHIGEIERARRRLLPLAGGDDDISEIARRYLAEIDRVQQATDREIRFAELRVAALRESFQAGTATAAEQVQLARSLVSLLYNGRPGYDWAEPAQVMKALREQDPRNVDALEMLTLIYSVTKQAARMREVLRDLERIAPDSAVLTAAEPQSGDDSYYESMRVRTGSLVEDAMRGGAEAEAALQSLRALVQRYPENEDYHSALMFSLAGNSDTAGALAQAEWLAQRPEPTHERHFNIAQVYWSAGNRQRAEEHFAEAYRLARTDQDRQDVLDRLEYLRGRDAGDGRN
jgi:tetratricopeptide (TPR) repeat protein